MWKRKKKKLEWFFFSSLTKILKLKHFIIVDAVKIRTNNKLKFGAIKHNIITTAVFLVRYIYSGMIILDNLDIACGLLYAAKKYLLPKSLQQQCGDFIVNNMDDNNVWRALDFAENNEELQIKAKANEVSTNALTIALNFHRIFWSYLILNNTYTLLFLLYN